MIWEEINDPKKESRIYGKVGMEWPLHSHRPYFDQPSAVLFYFSPLTKLETPDLNLTSIRGPRQIFGPISTTMIVFFFFPNENMLEWKYTPNSTKF